MAINGLQMGLTWSEMRHMKYTHLMQLLFEWEDMHGDEIDETRDATDADLRALMRL